MDFIFPFIKRSLPKKHLSYISLARHVSCDHPKMRRGVGKQILYLSTLLSSTKLGFCIKKERGMGTKYYLLWLLSVFKINKPRVIGTFLSLMPKLKWVKAATVAPQILLFHLLLKFILILVVRNTLFQNSWSVGRRKLCVKEMTISLCYLNSGFMPSTWSALDGFLLPHGKPFYYPGPLRFPSSCLLSRYVICHSSLGSPSSRPHSPQQILKTV